MVNFAGLFTLSIVMSALSSPCGIASMAGQAATREPSDLQMQLRFANGSSQFQVGEVITLEVLLSSTTPGRYLEPCELFSHGTFGYPQCRFFSRWTFTITPEEGWWDHAKDPPGIQTRSGPTYKVESHDLTGRPLRVQYILSGRFRFDQPGKYQVRLSIQVGLDDETTQWKRESDTKVQPHAVSVTREIPLEIVPAAAEWEQEVIRKGVEAYSGTDRASTKPSSRESLEQAQRALCNLATPEAARTFARLLSQGREVAGCLFHSPSVAAGVEEMQRLLVDPDAPVPGGFFTFLVALLNGDESRKTGNLMISQPIVDAQRETLFRALPQKRGDALIPSLMTVLSNPPRSKGGPFDPSYNLSLPEPVIAAAAANFDRFPDSFQSGLLEDGWDAVRSPLMLPVVRRKAEAGNGPALLRWLELDSAAATTFIRQEVVRPTPRFSSFYLRLPDASLPDQQRQIAANFVAIRDEQALIRSATLLHRYATRAVLPDVLPFIDANLSKWSCWLEFPVLAYLLKVSPEDALPRVNTVFEKLSQGGCVNWAFFTYLGALQPSPVLELLALEQIDTGTKYAADAAGYLQQYGSSEMKLKLWDQLERWSKGVAPAAGKNAGNGNGTDKTVQVDIVSSLAEALYEGHAWLLSPQELKRLEALVGKNSAEQLSCRFRCGAISNPELVESPINGRLNKWGDQRWAHQMMDYLYAAERLRYSVNQYSCPDLKSLQEKLLQFPPGYRFIFGGDLSDRDRDELMAISDFLWSHGYKVRNLQNWSFLRPDSPQ